MNKKFKITFFILLVTVFLLPFFSARNFSAASDEITHLPSGYSYWKTGLIQLNPQHPPLVKLLASFPLLFMDIKFDSNDPSLAGPLKDEWQFGRNSLFLNDADMLLLFGRIPIMLLSLLLGFYIFRWAFEMFNAKAGVLALFIYAFLPLIIANAQFITTDLPVTAFSFVTLYYLWKFFNAGRARNLIYSGLFLGLALGSKFSAVLLFPILIILILIHFWLEEETLASKINKSTKTFLILTAISSGIVWLIYLMPLDISFYLKGLKTVYADWSPAYKFYLNGNFSSDGWWYYFLFAFLMKTPIPVLFLFGLAAAMYKKYKLSLNDKLFIFVPFVVFFAVTSVKAGNIGIRYLLPIFPFLILYISGLAKVFPIKWETFKSKLTLVLATGLAGWYLFSALHIYPDYLAYFNELVGGSRNGYKHLDDSNLEWGQDLKRLANYQEQYPEMKVLYSWDYSNPSYYGVQNILLKEPDSFSNPSGRYAVNIHFLVRLRELSQKFDDKNLDWLLLYKPVDKIGHSFFIYEFKE